MGRKTTRRLFLGMPLSDEVRDSLMRDMARLAKLVPERSVGWVPEANLHLTLKFLGEVDEERVGRLSIGLSEKCSAWGVMASALHEGVVLFPGARRPRVVAAGVEGGDRLLHLAARLELWAEKEGFPREKRAFRPHITIGRVRKGGGPFPELSGGRITPLAFALDRVTLYESRLTPKGAQYIACGSVGLAP
ncbi:RNA 2',3'-cyclic phosphodiesterase [Desulfoluna limicola]|uniref:RNA 2',3'-cyclic phosphodiesterase n=1 Tax=Desulfoluna limicola TaxID=2810562 RepID=A0ABM7PM17_9BACT|nr:RNA 2',3'-cyclic phosphodiesterase [Desulfoluna limicola]BCS98304.1 RNA 2',3'-cyclic phosphodiesterase [Desulfoluna limicola]